MRKCECGHEKRDHRRPLMGSQEYGACKVCLCNQYKKVVKAAAATVVPK